MNTFGKIVPRGTRGALTDSLHLLSFDMDIEHDGNTELPSLCGCWGTCGPTKAIFKHKQEETGLMAATACCCLRTTLVFTSEAFMLLAFFSEGDTEFFPKVSREGT